MATAGRTGNLPIFPAITIDAGLNPTILLNEGEVVLPLAIGFSDTSSPAPRLAWDAVTTKLAVFDASTPLTENYVEGMAIDKVVLSAPAPASATSFETTDVLIDAGMSLGVFLNLQSAPYNALDAKGVVLPAAMKLTVADIQQMQLPQ